MTVGREKGSVALGLDAAIEEEREAGAYPQDALRRRWKENSR